MMDLKNKKILAISSGEHVNVMMNLYKYCRKYLNSEVYAFTISKDTQYFRELLTKDEQYIILPDLSIKQRWEDNSLEVQAVKDLMQKCEYKSGVPINRLILMNERNIGRAYSKYKYYWPERSICKRVLKNPDIADQVLIRGFKFAHDIINQVKPDVVLGGLIGSIYNSVVYLVSKYMEIPCISCLESSFLPDRHTWVSNWGSYPEKMEKVYQQKINNHEQPSQESLERIASFRKRPKILPVYEKMWKRKYYGSSLLSVNKYILKRIKYRLVPVIKRVPLSSPKPFWSAVIDAYRTYVNGKFHRRSCKIYQPDQLKDCKYIYFPMHMEPEYVLNTRGTSWFDQLNLIRLISYNLPMGYRLLVKEHRSNFGRRPAAYLKQLKSFPGVEIVNPFDDQFKYINFSSLVITINGTSGFEALMLKKPVITLSKTHYDCVSLAKKIKNLDDFGKTILESVYQHSVDSDYDKRLGLLLDADYATSIEHGDNPEKDVEFIKDRILNFFPCLSVKKKRRVNHV